MSNSPYKQFGTLPALEQEGVWIDFGGYEIKLARAGGANKRYAALLDTRMRPYRRQIQSGTLSEDTGKAIVAEVLAETVVLDWKGVLDEHDQPMEFSKENVVKLFNDLPSFYSEIMAASTDIANFRKEQMEEDAKK